MSAVLAYPYYPVRILMDKKIIIIRTEIAIVRVFQNKKKYFL